QRRFVAFCHLERRGFRLDQMQVFRENAERLGRGEDGDLESGQIDGSQLLAVEDLEIGQVAFCFVALERVKPIQVEVALAEEEGFEEALKQGDTRRCIRLPAKNRGKRRWPGDADLVPVDEMSEELSSGVNPFARRAMQSEDDAGDDLG